MSREPHHASLPEKNEAPNQPPHVPHGRPCAAVMGAVVVCLLTVATSAPAAPAGRAVQEAAEYVCRRFASEVGQEASQSLARRLTRLTAAHGDDAIVAFRKVGPRTFHYAAAAGEHGTKAVRLMARHGTDAIWVVNDPKRLALFARFGDDAAEVMIRHKGVAEPLLSEFGQAGASALKAIDTRNARRLRMLTDGGELARTGRADAVLDVVARYGDRAADFVWRHKGALTVAAVLTVFVNDPEPFIEGTRDLAELAVTPAAEAVRETAVQAARQTNWTAVWLAVLGLLSLAMLLRYRRRAPMRAANLKRNRAIASAEP